MVALGAAATAGVVFSTNISVLFPPESWNGCSQAFFKASGPEWDKSEGRGRCGVRSLPQVPAADISQLRPATGIAWG